MQFIEALTDDSIPFLQSDIKERQTLEIYQTDRQKSMLESVLVLLL